jgi:hypothetical protein
MKKILALILCVIGTPAFAASVTLTWDANTESDLAGYRVYRGTCGDPNPLAYLADVGRNVTFVDLQAPESGCVAYEVTAYDTSQNESARSNRAQKQFAVIYHKSVTDGNGNLWGLVGSGPKYRVYFNGQDLLPGEPMNNGSDLRVVNGVAQVQGTDGDTTWYVWNGQAWQVVPDVPTDPVPGPPAPPKGLKAE